MNKLVCKYLTCILLLQPLWVVAAETTPFSFGIIAKPMKPDPTDEALRESLAETDADNLAFVVANGLKTGNEPCTDNVYKDRRALLDSAKNGLVVSITANDWASCTSGKRSIAFERMNRLRDMLYGDEFSLGDSKIPVARQSAMPKFRSYAENMRWRVGDVVFATVNLPANNNNFLNAAGRNNEFEDRQIANSDWLKRLFITAKVNKLDGIVLFCDGNPLIQGNHSILFSSPSKREGFSDIRKQIIALAAKFHGKVLIVHNDDTARHPSAGKGIIWNDNIGTVHADGPWRKVSVNVGTPELFSIASQPMPAQAHSQ
jgi:hypothetical protein